MDASPEHLSRDELARHLRRLHDLEAVMQARTAELAWANERLVEQLYDRDAAVAAAERLARHDATTGLPNRASFEDRLARRLQFAGSQPAAVIVAGVERLNVVRETFGYAAGDVAVRQLADRLRLALRGSDVVARVGDDSFAVLLVQLRAVEDAVLIARKLFDAMDAPVRVDGRELRLEPALGVAAAPDDGADADTLLARADSAMRYARENGTGTFQYFRPDIALRAQRDLAVESALRAAIERDQFRVHFQPRFDLKTKRLTGAEALLRWLHPERGLIAPAEFLDVAEATGLIVPIGAAVLSQACAAAAAWPVRGGRALPVSVNLSMREFRGTSLLDRVSGTLAATGLPASRLQIEITESGLGRALDEVDAAALLGLRKLGVRVALDDFGAAWASLSVLRRMPVDALKIDGHFVASAPKNRRDAAIVAAITRLGRALGLQVVAEGIETRAQLEFARRSRCSEGQGYLLGRPMPAEVFAASLGAATKAPPRRPASSPRAARRVTDVTEPARRRPRQRK
jgi:diguanylate cyclase (GGDEF)-like protein